MENGDQFPAAGDVQNIEINNDSVATAFEIIVEEIEQVADEIDAQGAEHFKRSDHEAVRNALELAGKLITFKTKLSALQDEWSRTIDVSLRRRIEIGTAGGAITAGGNPKGPKTALRVTFADGETICDATAALTFSRVLQRIGLDEVSRQGRKMNGFPLISQKRCPLPYKQTPVGSYLVMTHCNTPYKKRLLEKIAITAGVMIKVEIVD
ncbi:MAG: hypothetical protein OJI67_20190 [Prosthecobacter sp.]|nr:hypothetical protein [Prosthecobacter sp.]